MEKRPQKALRRTNSVFTKQPSEIVDSAWHGLVKATPHTCEAARKSRLDLSETFSSIHEAQMSKVQAQGKATLQITTTQPPKSPEGVFSRASRTASAKQQAISFARTRHDSSPSAPGTLDSSKRAKIAYWNGSMAKQADDLLKSSALQRKGVAKLLGGRVGPPRHSMDGTVDYSNVGLGSVNFPALAESAASKTPKNKWVRLSKYEQAASNAVRVVTRGTPLDAPAMSNFTPVQLAILQIEKVRAQTRGSLAAIRDSHMQLTESVTEAGASDLRFTLRHKNRRKHPKLDEIAVATRSSQEATTVDEHIKGEVEYVSDSDASSVQLLDSGLVSSQLEQSAPQIRLRTSPNKFRPHNLDSKTSFQDDLVSVASDATWEPVWTRSSATAETRAQHVVAEALAHKSRQELVRKRAAARREAVRQRYQTILAQRQQRAQLAATENERKRAARRKAAVRWKLSTAIFACAHARMWWNLMTATQAETVRRRARYTAGKRIARWLEHQVESNVATKSARDRLIVTLFVRRYVRRTRDHQKRRMACAVRDFLCGVKRFGSRTRLLMQSKRYFGAVAIISGAWRRLRHIISCEQRMLTLLWAKYEHHLLQPTYKQLSRAQQRKSTEVHGAIHDMEEEELAQHELGLGCDELAQLGVPTPKCIVQRATRMHLFYMRHEFRDSYRHWKSIVNLMQPFLARKRRQLELAQRLAFQGRPSAFIFDESALEPFLPPMPTAYKAFLSKKAIQDMIEHTRLNLDRRVANADSWHLRRQVK